MNTIQPFQTQAIDKLKLWLANMTAKGHTKYYEIFVDTIRVVHKTENVDYFSEYQTWVDENTRIVRILIYNSPGSHRSQVFEYRTEKYIQETGKDELLSIASAENDALQKRLIDAEAHILKLEAELDKFKNKGSGFDLDKILSFAAPLIKQYPELTEKLAGLNVLQDNIPENTENKVEESEVTFKRKESS